MGMLVRACFEEYEPPARTMFKSCHIRSAQNEKLEKGGVSVTPVDRILNDRESAMTNVSPRPADWS